MFIGIGTISCQGRSKSRPARRSKRKEREARRLQASLSPQRGPRLSSLSLERFRTSSKYQDRPAAADIAFCVAAYANGMSEDRIERALEDDYLSRDPSPSKRFLHPENHDEGERLGNPLTYAALYRPCVFQHGFLGLLLCSEQSSANSRP